MRGKDRNANQLARWQSGHAEDCKSARTVAFSTLFDSPPDGQASTSLRDGPRFYSGSAS